MSEGCAYADIGDRRLGAWNPVEGLADCDAGRVFTAPAGSYLPNAFALYDMPGNAWEWTEDCWHEGYAGAPSDGSAWIASADWAIRVPRSASWNSHYRNVRSGNRGSYSAATRYFHMGFRVVRTDREN